VWATLAAVATIGCSPLSVVGFMFGGDDKITAPSPLAFGKDNPKKSKDEVVVLLFPHMAPGSSQAFFSADRDLATELARVLPEMAKQNKDKKKIRVIAPAMLDKFKTANAGTWKGMNPADIGQKLGADFVLDIDMSKLQIYQPHTSQGDRIYEGRAEVFVSVYEVGSDVGIKDSYAITFAHPRDRMVRDTSSLSESQFKKDYIANLAIEIAEHHVDHKPHDSLAGP
jgi:hypothetical protein